MIWFMGTDSNGKPNGWSEEPSLGYMQVPHEVRDLHEQNPDWLWNGVTLVAPVIPEPVFYVPSEAERVQMLWQGAHDYEFAEISGSAIGLLAIGVLQQKPKCLAVQNWIKTIWTEYYSRKANGSFNTDYSFAGSIPHSVPELMEELGI